MLTSNGMRKCLWNNYFNLFDLSCDIGWEMNKNKDSFVPCFVVEQCDYTKYICLLPFSSFTPPFSHHPFSRPTDYLWTHVPNWQFGAIHRIWTRSRRGQPIYCHVVQYLWAQSLHPYPWRRFVWPSLVMWLSYVSNHQSWWSLVMWFDGHRVCMREPTAW